MPAPILVISGPSGAGKTTVAGLVAARFDPSVHVPIDVFMPFVVNGRVHPTLPEAAHQNHIVGGAAASAALCFSGGGYAVVMDGHVFPDGLVMLAQECARRMAPLHYAVLRPDLDTCLGRLAGRNPAHAEDTESLARLHARYSELGPHESHVVPAAGRPDQVAGAVLSALGSGTLALTAQL